MHHVSFKFFSEIDACFRYMDRTIQHINKFATDGLRTMAVAVKTLSNEEYEYFSQAFYKAKNSLEDREAKLHKVYENLESNLELIGAIGIEDRLQENVRDTLINLSKAGIPEFNSQIWLIIANKFMRKHWIQMFCQNRTFRTKKCLCSVLTEHFKMFPFCSWNIFKQQKIHRQTMTIFPQSFRKFQYSRL